MAETLISLPKSSGLGSGWVEGHWSDPEETASAPTWLVRAAPYQVRSSGFTPSHSRLLKWICSGSRGMPVYQLSAPLPVPLTSQNQCPPIPVPLSPRIRLFPLRLSSTFSLPDSTNEAVV